MDSSGHDQSIEDMDMDDIFEGLTDFGYPEMPTEKIEVPKTEVQTSDGFGTSFSTNTDVTYRGLDSPASAGRINDLDLMSNFDDNLFGNHGMPFEIYKSQFHYQGQLAGSAPQIESPLFQYARSDTAQQTNNGGSFSGSQGYNRRRLAPQSQSEELIKRHSSEARMIAHHSAEKISPLFSQVHNGRSDTSVALSSSFDGIRGTSLTRVVRPPSLAQQRLREVRAISNASFQSESSDCEVGSLTSHQAGGKHYSEVENYVIVGLAYDHLFDNPALNKETWKVIENEYEDFFKKNPQLEYKCDRTVNGLSRHFKVLKNKNKLSPGYFRHCFNEWQKLKCLL